MGNGVSHLLSSDDIRRRCLSMLSITMEENAMFSKRASLTMLLVVLVAGPLSTGATLAEPPQTRPRAGTNPPPGNAGQQPRAATRQWPRPRTPGERPRTGQRSVTTKPLPTVRIDPNVAPPSQKWYLGVVPVRAPRGVRLTRIVEGSPASRFGLEDGDYILDVGGYVVGDYNGQYYPLSMAMDYGAAPNGWAELLVWNQRTFAEETHWVQIRRR